MCRLLAQAESMTIFGHQNARGHCPNVPGSITRYSTGISGCMLAWKYFFPDETPPRLIQHIQDNELGLFHLDATPEICVALGSHDWDFALFDRWCGADDLSGLAADGAAILRWISARARQA